MIRGLQLRSHKVQSIKITRLRLLAASFLRVESPQKAVDQFVEWHHDSLLIWGIPIDPAGRHVHIMKEAIRIDDFGPKCFRGGNIENLKTNFLAEN